jgi:hypothetical protein
MNVVALGRRSVELTGHCRAGEMEQGESGHRVSKGMQQEQRNQGVVQG